jgi:hypothetical protein
VLKVNRRFGIKCRLDLQGSKNEPRNKQKGKRQKAEQSRAEQSKASKASKDICFMKM